jgi:hypothetical protein
MVIGMTQMLEQPSVLVDVSLDPVLILFTLVYVKEVGVAVQTEITLGRAIVALKTEMAHANSLSAPFRRRKLTYGPWNLRIVHP